MQQASTTRQTRPFSCWPYLLIVCGLSWPFQFVSAIWARDLLSIYVLNAASMMMVTLGTFLCGRFVFRDGFAGAGWKWGKPWQPYGRRHGHDYESVRARVRQIVADRLPPSSAVIVASRGDDELVRFADREGWHFPQMPDGVYAGHYPADSAEAIEQLERLRGQGGRYFLLPSTSFWWLDHYEGLSNHLAQQYHEIVRDESCIVFALNGAS